MTDMRIFVCKICERDCETFHILKGHVQAEHREEFEGYQICCNFTLRPANCFLYTHFRLHLNKELFKCQECGKCLKSRKRLLGHVLENHGPSDRCKCVRCDERFPTADLLRIHIKRAHGRRYKCEYCQVGKNRRASIICPNLKKFCVCSFHFLPVLMNILSYNEHIKHKHDIVARFICESCGKGFVSKDRFNGHALGYKGGPRCRRVNKHKRRNKLKATPLPD